MHKYVRTYVLGVILYLVHKNNCIGGTTEQWYAEKQPWAHGLSDWFRVSNSPKSVECYNGQSDDEDDDDEDHDHHDVLPLFNSSPTSLNKVSCLL